MGEPEHKQDITAAHKSTDCAQSGMYMISMIPKGVIKLDYVTPTFHGRLTFTTNFNASKCYKSSTNEVSNQPDATTFLLLILLN